MTALRTHDRTERAMLLLQRSGQVYRAANNICIEVSTTLQAQELTANKEAPGWGPAMPA
jgi:hypothetical protein